MSYRRRDSSCAPRDEGARGSDIADDAHHDWPSARGETATLLRARDWSQTPLGDRRQWPPELRATLEVLFASGLPMSLRLGPDECLIYNDAYAALLGERHPYAFGEPVATVFHEIGDRFADEIARALAGEAVVLPGAYCPLLRGGKLEDAWFDISMSPYRGAGGVVEGTLTVSIETTRRVLAERRNERTAAALREREARLQQALEGAGLGTWSWEPDSDRLQIDVRAREILALETGEQPSLANLQATLLHPDDVGAFATRLAACTDPTGDGRFDSEHRILRPDGREAWVRQTGQARFDDEAGGRRVRIVVGTLQDITVRRLADIAMQDHEVRQTFLLQLGDRIRDLADAGAISAATVAALGAHLGASRAVYAEIGADPDLASVVADWTDGSLPSVRGEVRLDAFGPGLAAYWRRGLPGRIDDLAADRRDAVVAGRDGYAAFGIAAAICAPLLRGGRTVAVIAVHSAVPRRWTDAEVGLLQEVAERTRAAIDRAHAEAARRDSEARYRLLFDAIAQGFCTIEVLFDEFDVPYDYRFLEVNASFTRQTGLQDAVGRTVRELVPAHEQLWMDTYGRIAVTGEPELFEAQAKALDRWYEVYAFRVGEPRQRRVAVLFNDISARRRAEQALRDSELQLSTLVAGIPQMVWRALEGGDATWVSPQWCAFTGQTFAQAMRFGWFDTVHPDDREASLQAWSRAPKAGLLQVDHRIRRADGEYVWHSTRARPLCDSAGGVVEWLGTTTDVQRLVELQQEKDRLVDQLADADRRKDRFIATLAHELRNPLAPMTNAVHVLGLADGDRERVEAMRQLIDRQLRLMVRLVDDLLDVSRIRRGEVTLRRHGFDLAQAVRAAIETSRPLVDAHRHALAVALPDAPVPVVADEMRIAQVIANLLNNAAKYTPHGGHLSVRLQRRDDGVAEVVVADDGIGIPPAMLSDVFEMFVQAPDARGRSLGGLGLGLAIARQMAEMHGGTLTGHSDGPGCGSTFVLTLPIAHGEPPAAREEVLDGRRGALRVLVVDDNRDAADSMASLLRAMGHDVRTAYGGHDGLAQAQAFAPQLALVDIGMPEMDGHELGRRLRASPIGADLLLVALTGWGQHDDRERSRAAGFDEHITKPIDATRLAELVCHRVSR